LAVKIRVKAHSVAGTPMEAYTPNVIGVPNKKVLSYIGGKLKQYGKAFYEGSQVLGGVLDDGIKGRNEVSKR